MLKNCVVKKKYLTISRLCYTYVIIGSLFSFQNQQKGFLQYQSTLYNVHIQANIYNILYLFSKFFSVLTRLGVFPTLSYYNVYCTIHFVNVCLILFIQGTFPSSGLFAGVLCTAVPLHCRHSAALLMNHQAKIIYISFFIHVFVTFLHPSITANKLMFY